MTAFVRRVLSDGEDPESTVILLETEFPCLVDRVSVMWIEVVGKGV